MGCNLFGSDDESSSGTESSSSTQPSTKDEKPVDLSNFYLAEDAVYLDMVVRDFSTTHPDFENFANRVPNSECAGGELLYVKAGNLDWVEKFTGRPGVFQSVGDTMYYGQEYIWNASLETYWHYYEVPISRVLWSDSITIVKNMAKKLLVFDPDSVLEARPEKASNTCYNSQMNDWFRDVPGTNYRSDQLLKLSSYTLGNGEKVFGYDSFLEDGFFPLDSVDDGDFGFGKQNIDEWCPPEHLSDEGRDGYLCSGFWREWSDETGLSTYTERNYAARNYNFTTTIAFSFVYQPGQWFVIANDEFWVYADGKMIVDAGGDHLPPEFMVYLDTLAESNNWEANTPHTLHFFLAERQTNAADLRFYTNIEQFSYPQHAEESDPVLSANFEFSDEYPWMRTEVISSSSSAPPISYSRPTPVSSSSGPPVEEITMATLSLDGDLTLFGDEEKSYKMRVDTILENCDLQDADSAWVVDCDGSQVGRVTLTYTLEDSVYISPVLTVRSFITFSPMIESDSIDLELNLFGIYFTQYRNIQIRDTREADGRNDLRFYRNGSADEIWNTLILDITIHGDGEENILHNNLPGDMMFTDFLITSRYL